MSRFDLASLDRGEHSFIEAFVCLQEMLKELASLHEAQSSFDAVPKILQRDLDVPRESTPIEFDCDPRTLEQLCEDV